MSAGLGLLGVLLALSTACSSDDADFSRVPPADPPSGGAAGENVGGAPIAFCDALKVVRAKCQRCHGAPLTNGAPAPFLTYDDFLAPYGSSGQTYGDVAVRAVEDDVMPYVVLNDGANPIMPPVEPLTTAEKATLLGWLKQGMKPAGGTACP